MSETAATTVVEDGDAECPVCAGMTATENSDGTWNCSAGCHLDGYRTCPGHGGPFKGNAAFCPECESAQD